MKKEIKAVDKEKKIIRITTIDERWYAIENLNEKTGLPEYKFIPSVTWIADYLPKGIGFYKWLADKGWDESQGIKEATGNKGSKVHQAVEALTKGEIVKIDDQFMNYKTSMLEELTTEEYECILSFSNWYNKTKPEILETEKTVINEKENYAGTLDIVCKINGEKYIIDLKTSQNIYDSHKAQIAAYKHAGYTDCKLAVLQLGYKKNNTNFKFTEIEDYFGMFQAAKTIWSVQTKGVKPKQKDYPMEIKL